MLINKGECVAYSRRPGLKLEVQRHDPEPPSMRCRFCNTHRSERSRPQRRARPSRVAICERCGEPILSLPDIMLDAGDGRLAQLARFGLAITGDPLLELKREGI